MRVPGEPVLPCFRINQTFCREIALNLSIIETAEDRATRSLAAGARTVHRLSIAPGISHRVHDNICDVLFGFFHVPQKLVGNAKRNGSPFTCTDRSNFNGNGLSLFPEHNSHEPIGRRSGLNPTHVLTRSFLPLACVLRVVETLL